MDPGCVSEESRVAHFLDCPPFDSESDPLTLADSVCPSFQSFRKVYAASTLEREHGWFAASIRPLVPGLPPGWGIMRPSDQLIAQPAAFHP